MSKLLVMVAGESGQGKSASLMKFRNPESVFYLGTESNKPLPFPDKFKKLKSGMNNPNDVFTLFNQLESMPEIETIVIDSLTFLMDMFESKNVLGSANSMKSWSDYQQYFKQIMQDVVAKSSKNWIFIAHNTAELQNDGTYKYYIPVKGALKNQGAEAYFSIIVYARRVKITELEALPYDENLLHITERDRLVGYKHVFQCDVTKELANSRIRSPIGCFASNQIFMDNDTQLLIDHLNKYYGFDDN